MKKRKNGLVLIFYGDKLRKLNAILHDVTFLNFPFLWTQVKRYRSIGFLFPILVILSLFSFEQTQFTVYGLNIEAKVSGKPGSGVMAGLSQSMMMEGQSSLSYEELSAFVGSYEFQHYLAEEIVNNPSFYSMNFSPLNATSLKKWPNLLAKCKQSKPCEIEKLTNTIGRFFDIKKGQSEGRFIFSVNSLDPSTTQTLAHILTKVVVDTRLKNTQNIYMQQTKHAEEMIQKSREEMIKHGGMEVLNQYKTNEIKIEELKVKLTSLQNTLNQDLSNFSTTEFKLKETNGRSIGSASSNHERIYNEKFKRQILKIDELRQNVAAVSMLPENERTKSDEAVLVQMQKEIKRLEKEVNFSSKNSQQIIDDDAFKAVQSNNKNYLDFDYHITRKKIAKEEAEIKSTSEQIEQIIQANLKLESSSSILRQDLEYIKLLESKLISIKLMVATITADILFEKYNTQLDEFNRSSGVKNLLFAFLVSLTLCFLLLLIRYFTDDRLYEEHEVKKCFENLTIIGKTPDFK